MTVRVTWGAACLAILGVLPGCSALFMNGVPNDHARRADFACSRSRSAPVVDTVLGATTGVLAMSLLAEAASADSDVLVGALVVAVPTVLFVGSAIHGYVSAAECRDALDDLNQRLFPVEPIVSPTTHVSTPPTTPADTRTDKSTTPHAAPVLLFSVPPSSTVPATEPPVPEPPAPTPEAAAP